jgi:predicted TIM-barrel fold metal-dependent hydrolase
MRYARSSVDADIRFMVQNLDQRMSLGSDFPEYTPAEALARFAVLTEGLPERKRENVAWRNLAALFGPDG